MAALLPFYPVILQHYGRMRAQALALALAITLLPRHSTLHTRVEERVIVVTFKRRRRANTAMPASNCYAMPDQL